jgi:hypothetical protein
MATKSILKRKISVCQWLTPVILATGEERSGGSHFKASLGNSSQDPILKIHTQKRAGRVAQVPT